jgi:alpha-galactosidase
MKLTAFTRLALLALLVGLLQAIAFVGTASTGSASTTPTAGAQGSPGLDTGQQPQADPAAGAPGSHPGLAQTPPMGWNDWYTFYCNIDEDLVKQTADAMVSSGMRDAGYNYVNLDDCWAGARDANGNMTADPKKFPHGIKALADYVHARGLKLGVYTDVGPKTCAGYTAGYNNEKRDVDTFASWGVDFVKVDWCAVPYNDFPGMTKQEVAKTLYTRWSKAFNEASRPMLFSMCVWEEAVKSWEFAPQLAQMWRTSADYGDSWDQIMRNGDQAARLHDLAGPGGWNDPDILMVGHGQLNNIEYRTQFSIWSMAAAPLLAGNDLRTMTAATREILTNKDVIAIDQDALGEAGRKVHADADTDVWARPLANGDTAVLLVNRTSSDRLVSTDAKELGLPKSSRYTVRDLWDHRTLQSAGTFSGYLPPHGSRMVRISAAKGDPTRPMVSWGATPHGTVPGLDTTVVAPGSPLTLDGVARNDGPASIEGATASLTAPDGWTVKPTTTTSLPQLHRAGGQVATSWSVAAPEGTQPGRYSLRTTLRYAVDGVPGQEVYDTDVLVPSAPPAGKVALSDLTWLDEANGYGPPLKDRNYYGDPLSIGGQQYPKGLWTNAAAHLGYYLGGRCSTFTTDMGIDDSKGSGGSVVYSIYVDGQQVYKSPVLHGSDATAHASVSVAGARSLRIAVDDGGDGVTNDNADWGAPTLTCS